MNSFTSGSVVEDDSRDVCIANLDRALHVTEASDGFLAGLGRPTADVCGRHFGQFVHASVKPGILARLDHLVEGRLDRFRTGFRGSRATGGSFAGDLTGLAVRGAGRRISAITLLVDGVVEVPGEDASPVPSAAGGGDRPLSDTDARVLEGVAAGYSTTRLADRLFLSRQGVDYHVGTLLRRFRSPNRPALVAKAYVQGVLRPGSWPPRVAPEFVR
jgi:DNA-binding CsgD family transcriptional regulator